MINFWPVLVCAIVSMVIGSIWYGPLFGKKWMHIMGAGSMSEEEKKKMQKGMMPMYLTQFLLSLFQIWVLSWYISFLSGVSGGVHTAFSIWIAFIVPTLAGSAMWTRDSSKIKWSKFLIQAGYQLVSFVIFALILVSWK